MSNCGILQIAMMEKIWLLLILCLGGTVASGWTGDSVPPKAHPDSTDWQDQFAVMIGVSPASDEPRPNGADPAQNASPAMGKDRIAGGVVLCDHWTQHGIGELFPEGEVNGQWYRRNFSMVFNLEQGRRWTAQSPENRICYELDAYFLDSLAEEDPNYLKIIRKEIDAGRMELVGGTYGQAESQVFGYESAIRQLTMGQAAVRRHLGRLATTYIVEEQNFFTQLPQLLKQAGFRYASLQFQNSGTPDVLPHDLILWESPDGSTMPTIPPHPGMVSCAAQRSDYSQVLRRVSGRPAPLIFQWLELWVPGYDWGASLEPYQKGIQGLAAKGMRQMLLTEYIDWAKGRVDPPRVRIRMDNSNYDNNFYGGGWGYENEKTARGANQCESLLLVAEALCAADKNAAALIRPELRDLWSRLLAAQNHDAYLAGGIPAYIDGLRTYQSELAVKQFQTIRRILREKMGLGRPVSTKGGKLKLFNPCPWPVSTPALFEVDAPVWPEGGFVLRCPDDTEQAAIPRCRGDNGNVLVGPVMLHMPAYGVKEVTLRPKSADLPKPRADRQALHTSDGGHSWRVTTPGFEDIVFEPLVGQWQEAPAFGHPNVNVEVVHPQLGVAPVTRLTRAGAGGLDVLTWRQDLMHIRDVPESAMSIDSLALANTEGESLVEFQHRLSSVIRFATGAQPPGTWPPGTWRFRVRVPAVGLRIVADSPFGEEQRKSASFYCSRYVRLEWPDRHVLWCPSQNTLFRRTDEKDAVIIELTFFGFAFQGTANWGMRFHAGKKFTAAQSMRLAETFHRGPTAVPEGFDLRPLEGIFADNPDVLITHVFPASDGTGVAMRVLNASGKPQSAMFRWPGRAARVAVADLDGRPIRQDEWLPVGRAGEGWRYGLRPWEIATFHFRQTPQ